MCKHECVPMCVRVFVCLYVCFSVRTYECLFVGVSVRV